MSERTICPPDHAHGKNSTCRAQHHCKCEDCTTFGREYEFWRQGQLKAGRPLQVPSTGAIRRLRALQRLGWSLSAIGHAAGHTESWPHSITRQTVISTRTDKEVRAVYDALSMRIPVGTTPNEIAAITRARRYAERQGWPPPLAWDDDAIDLPDNDETTERKAAA